jgi:small subunit ribosomal protein S6
MQRYELLLLSVPAITQDEIKKLESEIEKIIKKGGNLISFEKWGKYRLAYPVKKNDYGVYFLVRFEVKDEQVTEILEALRTFFAVKLHEMIMRSLFSVLDKSQSLDYIRPQSLEEIPDRQEGDELNKKKIEKILSKAEAKSTPIKSERSQVKVEEEIEVTEK